MSAATKRARRKAAERFIGLLSATYLWHFVLRDEELRSAVNDHRLAVGLDNQDQEVTK